MESAAPWVQGAVAAGLFALYWLSQTVFPPTDERADGDSLPTEDTPDLSGRGKASFAAGLACTAAYALCLLAAAAHLVIHMIQPVR